MDSSGIGQLFALIVLVILSAFFSSAETAVTTANRHILRALSEDGNKRARKVLRIMENPQKVLSTILIGNNIVNLSASSLATTFTVNLLKNNGVRGAQSIGAGVATGVLTFVILVFGEVSPKTIATAYSEKLALIYVDIIAFLMIIFSPFIWIVKIFSSGVLILFGLREGGAGKTMTERELRAIVDVSHEDGVLENEEHEIINNLFDFGDSVAKDIMCPRIDMVFASTDNTYDEIVDMFIEEQYSRLPVYDETKDTVVGILYLKDLYFYRSKHKNEFDLKKILREPFFTYEFQKISVLFQEMRSAEVSFAIVLDEYGATAGLITLEDILEEIVGDMRDEYDADEKDAIRCVGDKVYEVEGGVKIDDLNDQLGTTLESEDFSSIGGYIIGILDRLPKVGEVIEEGNIEYRVLEVDKNRIEKIRMTIKELS